MGEPETQRKRSCDTLGGGSEQHKSLTFDLCVPGERRNAVTHARTEVVLV